MTELSLVAGFNGKDPGWLNDLVIYPDGVLHFHDGFKSAALTLKTVVDS